MDIQLYNTLTKRKEKFEPLKAGFVSMYNCGPTVYDRAHVGNLRSYVFADVLRRTLEYNKLEVQQVINITDVGHLSSDADFGDDKMTKALKREGLPLTLEAMKNVGNKYTELFIEDLQKLNIEMPSKLPKASDHIADDIEIIKQLETKNYTYTTADGVYFDTSRWPNYGKLSNIKPEQQTAPGRLPQATEKRNPADFVLWKLDRNIGWNSPWGQGFPGWHIECSVMSRKYLGQPFDIHTGGMDHIPIHHNNEIAQSEAAYDTPLANYWIHNAFLTIEAQKMAKSAGNYVTLDTLLSQSISPLAYRYWLLTASYRTPINMSMEAVLGAQNALIRLMTTISDYPTGGVINHEYQERFLALINDDLDTPQAIALVWDILKNSDITAADKRATIVNFDQVFGLGLGSIKTVADVEFPPEIVALAEAREEARLNKEWRKADVFRDELKARGYDIVDAANGYKLKRQPSQAPANHPASHQECQ